MENKESLIEAERRAELESQVREIMASRAALDALREEHLTFGERAADRMATVAGSWTFIFAFLAVVALWVALNTFAWISHWALLWSDPHGLRSAPKAGFSGQDFRCP